MKKRVVLLHHVVSLGGGTNSLIDIAKMLREDYEVTVCIPKGGTELTSILSDQNITYHELRTPIPSLNVYSGSPSYASRYFLSCLLRFYHVDDFVEELMTLEPDAVVYNTSVTSLIARHMPRSVRNIGFVRETMSKQWATRMLHDVYEEYFSGVAFIAEHERRALGLSGPVQAIVPDCLDPVAIKLIDKKVARATEGIPDDVFVILFMGGDSPIKGIEVFLKACASLGEGFLPIVAGVYHEEMHTDAYIVKHLYHPLHVRQLLRTRRSLNVLKERNAVRLVGYRRDTAALMSACDIVAFPSTKAHQPRPCIEAGEYGKPVVISDFEATTEYFRDGLNALVFKPGNSHDLAKTLFYAREHPEELARMGEANRRATREMHDFAKTQAILREFLERAIGGR